MILFLGLKFGSVYFASIMNQTLCGVNWPLAEPDWLKWSHDNTTQKETTGWCKNLTQISYNSDKEPLTACQH